MDVFEFNIHCTYWYLVVSAQKFPAAELQKLKAKALTHMFEKHHTEKSGK